MSVLTENKVVKSADHETTMGYVLKKYGKSMVEYFGNSLENNENNGS